MALIQHLLRPDAVGTIVFRHVYFAFHVYIGVQILLWKILYIEALCSYTATTHFRKRKVVRIK